ncbi:MAG TPA: Bax inhibitor-1/YccA family protein [Rhodobacteraceae bacterium]|nr:Bax inhibitor-1/YccA family protein [Paracoccaceae bacterium]
MANNSTIRRAGSATMGAEIDAGLRAHMNKVYGLMAIGLAVTGLIAYIVGNDVTAVVDMLRVGLPSSAAQTTIIPASLIETMFVSPVRYVLIFSPIILAMVLQGMVNRISRSTAQMMFYVMSALFGLSLSIVFAVYTSYSITSTFLITSIAFTSLSLWGYTTKKDISGWGSFLMMGLVGLILVMIVNIFLQSEAVQFAFSAIGVLLFAALTAYDTQKIKTTYLQMANHPDGKTWLEKSAIMGALQLYLDFLNLFLFLLHFLGMARD